MYDTNIIGPKLPPGYHDQRRYHEVYVPWLIRKKENDSFERGLKKISKMYYGIPTSDYNERHEFRRRIGMFINEMTDDGEGD